MDQYYGAHAVIFMTDSQFNTYVSSAGKTKHMHSWNDWRLIPTEKPVIPEPEIKENILEIPGRNGFVDLTEVLTGRPIYGKRSGSLTFVTTERAKDWEVLKRQMALQIHGKRQKIILEDDNHFFYEGRLSLNAWKSEAQRDKITINYELNPFKMIIFGENDYWKWDPFSFVSGIITSRNNVAVDGTLRMRCPQGDYPGAHPTIIASAAMSVQFGGTTYQLSAGTNVMNDITFVTGENILNFTGNGTVSIKYKAGWL